MEKLSLKSRRFTRALYPGRFQPFHLGHLDSVKQILDNSFEIIIMVGSALQSHTLQNPFTAGERVQMIKIALNEGKINPSRFYIIPVTDLQIHSIWVSHVCSLVPSFDIVYSNEPLTKRLFLEANFIVQEIPFFNRKFYQATEIRKRMLLDKSWERFLPTKVANYIKEINGVMRLKDLVKTDKINTDI